MDAEPRSEIVVTDGDARSRRAWRRSRLLHLVTTTVGLTSWLVGVVGGLFWGGAPSPGGLPDDAGLVRAGRRRDVWPARILLHRTTGWPRDWQVDLSRSFAVRWRGPGAFIAGALWVSDGSIRWAPNDTWTEFGARGFELRSDSVLGFEVTRFSRRSVGLVIRGRDGVQVWLWLRGRDPTDLIDELQKLPQS
jgi:hypothetical protein